MPEHDAPLHPASIAPPGLSARRDDLGDLLQPTFRDRPARDADAPRPWRLGSIVYVAFLGGALAGGTISLLNARRLGLPGRIQAALGGLAVLGLAGALLAAALLGDPSSGGGVDQTVRFAIRATALAAYGGMYLLLRSADRVHHFHAGDDAEPYASLWIPGAIAVAAFGLAELVLVAGVAGSLA